MRADFFVAEREDAFAYDAFACGDGLKLNVVGLFETGNLTSIEISTLWAILENTSWDSERHLLPELLSDGEGESWMHEFPLDLVLSLASLNDSSLQMVAVKWSETEELHCSPTDLVPGLKELRRLAQLAEREGESVFLWGTP